MKSSPREEEETQTHLCQFLLLNRRRTRDGVSGFATGRRSSDGFGLELRPGFAGHNFRRQRRGWWRQRRLLRRCRRKCERGVGLERRPQHRGAQTPCLGRLATIQPTTTATPRTTSVLPWSRVQFRLLRHRLNVLWRSVPLEERLPAVAIGAYRNCHVWVEYSSLFSVKESQDRTVFPRPILLKRSVQFRWIVILLKMKIHAAHARDEDVKMSSSLNFTCALRSKINRRFEFNIKPMQA